MKAPNVILLTVDSMRWDRVGRNGYARPVTPEIDAMMSKSISCSRSYSLCPSTTGAFPSIMTSSRPLSYGGFDHGVFRRPPTLSAMLAKAGYHVTHLSTVHWVSSFFGYSEGVAEEEFLISFGMIAHIPSVLLRASFTRFNSGSLSLETLVSEADLILPAYFENLRRYCEFRSKEPKRSGKILNSRFGSQSHRWESVGRAVDLCAASFQRDKAQFLREAARSFQKTGRWVLDKNWRYQRAWAELVETAAREGAGQLLRPFASKISNRLRRPHKWYIDADTLVDEVLSTAERSALRDGPFFIWTHLMDAHIPYASGAGRSWAKDAATWLDRVGHNPSIDATMTMGRRPNSPNSWEQWCSLYDAALCFIDHHIGRLRRTLALRGLENTLIVISGDHGEELGEHGDSSHKFRLYEHNARIPTLFFHPDLRETEVSGFSTLMDIAPTVADLASVPSHPSWEGGSLLKLPLRPRQQVILESVFGSPCDLESRPIYMAAREGRFKLMYNQAVDPSDKLSKPGVQLFDVVADPSEQTNIASDHSPIVTKLLQPIHCRLED